MAAVDPHITTMNRKYLPASISGPYPDYDDTGHDLVDPTTGPEPPAGTIYQGVLGVALSGSYVGFNTGVHGTITPDAVDASTWMLLRVRNTDQPEVRKVDDTMVGGANPIEWHIPAIGAVWSMPFSTNRYIATIAGSFAALNALVGQDVDIFIVDPT